VLGLDGQGGAQLYADYWQWEEAAQAPPKPDKPAPPPKPPSAKKKLSYLEAREWEQMETLILEAERELDSIRAEMHSPDVVSDAPRLHLCYQNLQSAESRVQSLYARWAELESKHA
jgi:ATP-binding cassette subfamily F protein uup